MASYQPPNSKYDTLYNPDYFIGREEQNAYSDQIQQFNGDFVNRDGSSIMTGGLTTPSITLYNNGTIQYSDDTIQTTAFLATDRSDADQNKVKLTRQSYDADTNTTEIIGSLKISKIIYADDSNQEQVIAFTNTMNTSIDNTLFRTTDISFDFGLLKTTIGNSCHINSLTCGNFNTTHLSNTTSNLQTQISANTNKLDLITTHNDGMDINGYISLPTISLNNSSGFLSFFDNTIQQTAFTDAHKNKLEAINGDTDTSLQTQINEINDDLVVLNNELNVNSEIAEIEYKLQHLVLIDDDLSPSEYHMNSDLLVVGTVSSANITTIEDKLQHQYTTSSEGIDATQFNSQVIVNDNLHADSISTPSLEFNSSPTPQTRPYTDLLDDKLTNTTLINSSNRLDCNLIGNGSINNSNFQHLSNIDYNIKSKLEELQSQFNNSHPDYYEWTVNAIDVIGVSHTGSSGFGQGDVLNSTRTYYSYNHNSTFFNSTNRLYPGRYELIITVNGGSFNWIQELHSYISICHLSSCVDDFKSGVHHDSSISEDPYIYYTMSKNFEVTNNESYFTLTTRHWFKANSGCNIKGQFQLKRYLF